jgi:hypothetical protein
MLSSQCNKLRCLADDVQRIKENNADWLWRDAVTLVDAATEMRHAADTIKSLSDNLSDMVDCRERARELERENAKLQVFSLAFANTISNIGCDPCPYEGECYVETEPMRRGCQLYDELRSLGIEVEE